MSGKKETIVTKQTVVRPSRKKKAKKSRGSAGDVNIPMLRYVGLNKLYHFKRKQTATLISQVALSDTLGSLQFTFSGMNGYSELTVLFDSYRIDFVEVQFKPMFNMLAVTSAGSIVSPFLYTVIDLDDATTPGTLGELLEYATVKETSFDKPVTRTLTPMAAKALYDGSVFTSYGMNTGERWVDCNSPGVKHYGVKYGIQAGLSGQTNLQSWKLDFTYYVSMRMTR